jgi:hypothetical protein
MYAFNRRKPFYVGEVPCRLGCWHSVRSFIHYKLIPTSSSILNLEYLQACAKLGKFAGYDEYEWQKGTGFISFLFESDVNSQKN